MPTPPRHLTASAVVVTPDGTRVLLRHPRFGRWGPLGGHVEGTSPCRTPSTGRWPRSPGWPTSGSWNPLSA
ncbi:MAG TPA: hypothetical protein VIM19_14675 [Actinomycetes bacterium]